MLDRLLVAPRLSYPTHAVELLLGLRDVLVADRADDGVRLPAADVRGEPHVLDRLKQMLEVGLGVIGAQDEDHEGTPWRLAATRRLCGAERARRAPLRKASASRLTEPYR